MSLELVWDLAIQGKAAGATKVLHCARNPVFMRIKM
jgi:hypothetical protein